MSTLTVTQQTSTTTVLDSVWNPNTRTEQVYTIVNIVKAPDTFCYGQIEEKGKIIDVHYSPFKHMWSR